MATPKVHTTNDVVRRHRLKRRLLHNLTAAWKRKDHQSRQVRESCCDDGGTDSDESEAEHGRQEKLPDMRKEVFVTKRTIDQSDEGSILRQAMRDLAAQERLLPPADAEIEEEDSYERFERFMLTRQDSSSTIKSNQTHDSISSRLADCSHAPQNAEESPIFIAELKSLLVDEPMLVFYDDTSTSYCKTKKRRSSLKVRFADEVGDELEKIHWTLTMYSEEETNWIRIIILLLCPSKKKFEFLHVSFDKFEKTSISDILGQLPGLATDQALREQSYIGLIRKEGERELINKVSIQSYHLRKDEVLIAVVEGHYSKGIVRMAQPLVENNRILRAVKRARQKNKVVVRKFESRVTAGVSDRVGNSNIEPYDEDDVISAEPPQLYKMLQRSLSSSSFSSEYSIPNMDDVGAPSDVEKHLSQDHNQDKVYLTRFVNAGILTAMVYGVHRAFAGRR